MRAGRLDCWVQLKHPVETLDGYGDPVKTWALADAAWAGIEPLKGREFFEAQQVNAELTVRVVLRYRTDVASTWRVEHEGHTYEVTAPPLHNRRNDETLLMCRELT